MTFYLVFQKELDVLGMAIYGTELVLWIGVMICGGYFNLVPWMGALISKRRQRRDEERLAIERGHDIALHDLPSSTSVFRTPSSVIRERYVQR